jgi:hypothetical protein
MCSLFSLRNQSNSKIMLAIFNQKKSQFFGKKTHYTFQKNANIFELFFNFSSSEK